MADAPQQPTPCSSDAVIQTLKWARKQGFKPVPLRKKSKAALDERYVDPGYVPPADERWLSQDLGIGVVTGPRQGGPVDIDVDCDEARFFAKKFLPPTAAVFGRKSNPLSHYLYRVEVESFPKKALIDPITRSCIIEMRGDGGHQTVFPGSLHEDTGEVIEWADKTFPDVLRVGDEALIFAVKKVAIATLVVRHMWSEGQRNEICKHLAGMLYYLDWTEEEVQSLIAAVMEYTGDNDKTRLRTVSITFNKGDQGGKVTGSNTLRTFLAATPGLVDRILEWAGSTMATLLQDYNERFAVVSVEGKFRIAETVPLERGGPPILYAKEDFLNIMAPDTVTIDDKPVAKAKVWLANARRRTYRAIDFLPGIEDASPVLNLWTGWPVDPAPEKDCVAWRDLLFQVICGNDDTLYNWMMNWFANIVREPRLKPLTAPVIIGRQGAGKSLLFGYFGKLLGPAYVTITNEEHIYGRFNKHLSTALLLHSEEALYGGEKKHRGIIKSLITDDFRIYEPKGIDAKTVHNYLRLALTSNESWAAPAEVGDRRFTVIDMEERKASDSLIKAVLWEMNNGGASGLLHYLFEEWKYDPAVPRTNVKNEALISLKEINLDPVARWWYECLMMGQLLPEYLAWAARPSEQEWPQVVSSSALFLSMTLKLRERGLRYTPDQTSFALMLTKMLGQKLTRVQKYFKNPLSDDAPREVRLMGDKHYTIMDMPNLEYCRTAFDRFVGQEHEWPAADEDRPAHLKI